ncbi:hypothetical protein GINT2_002142 [Glugoides intestinalis]
MKHALKISSETFIAMMFYFAFLAICVDPTSFITNNNRNQLEIGMPFEAMKSDVCHFVDWAQNTAESLTEQSREALAKLKIFYTSEINKCKKNPFIPPCFTPLNTPKHCMDNFYYMKSPFNSTEFITPFKNCKSTQSDKIVVLTSTSSDKNQIIANPRKDRQQIQVRVPIPVPIPVYRTIFQKQNVVPIQRFIPAPPQRIPVKIINQVFTKTVTRTQKPLTFVRTLVKSVAVPIKTPPGIKTVLKPFTTIYTTPIFVPYLKTVYLTVTKSIQIPYQVQGVPLFQIPIQSNFQYNRQISKSTSTMKTLTLQTIISSVSTVTTTVCKELVTSNTPNTPVTILSTISTFKTVVPRATVTKMVTVTNNILVTDIEDDSDPETKIIKVAGNGMPITRTKKKGYTTKLEKQVTKTITESVTVHDTKKVSKKSTKRRKVTVYNNGRDTIKNQTITISLEKPGSYEEVSDSKSSTSTPKGISPIINGRTVSTNESGDISNELKSILDANNNSEPDGREKNGLDVDNVEKGIIDSPFGFKASEQEVKCSTVFNKKKQLGLTRNIEDSSSNSENLQYVRKELAALKAIKTQQNLPETVTVTKKATVTVTSSTTRILNANIT